MARAPLSAEIEAVEALCRRIGLGAVAPVLLKAAHHTTLALPPLELVARVQSGEPPEVAYDTALRELAVSRHLAARGAPVVAPLDDALAGPHRVAGAVVTLWRHVAQDRTATEADAELAAATLADLHRGLSDYPDTLPSYTETLDRCRDVLPCTTLDRTDRDLLGRHLGRLRGEIEAGAGALVPIHGDAHLGNLLLGHTEPCWIDLETVCRGPPALDIAGLPPEAWPRFDDADPALVRRCADLKSVCVAIWCSVDPSRSAEVRAAAAHHLRRARRLES